MHSKWECNYRDAFRKPAQLLVPDVDAQFIQLLLDISGHFTAEQRQRARNHRRICRNTQTACSNQVSEQSFMNENTPGQGPPSPVFPIIFSHGWSVRMLSSSGEMSGVRDHSRTVLSLLQLAMVKGRLWWQVKPTCTALLRLNMIKGSL